MKALCGYCFRSNVECDLHMGLPICLKCLKTVAGAMRKE